MCSSECLKLAKLEKVVSITLELETKDTMFENYQRRELRGTFYWEFEGQKLVYEEFFGSFLSIDSPGSRRELIDRANIKLEHAIAKISKAGYRLKGDKAHFDEKSVQNVEQPFLMNLHAG